MYNTMIGTNGFDSIVGIQDDLQEIDQTYSIQLVYGKEVVMSLEFVVPSLGIAVAHRCWMTSHYNDGWTSCWN
jgi:hypothetical protein